jgi:hypothetical protein
MDQGGLSEGDLMQDVQTVRPAEDDDGHSEGDESQGMNVLNLTLLTT